MSNTHRIHYTGGSRKTFLCHRTAEAAAPIGLLADIVLAALFVFTALYAAPPAAAFAQEAESPAAPSLEELRELRDALLEDFQNNDFDALLEHVHPDAVVTWQNGEVSRGHDEVKAYHERMTQGPNSIVVAVKGNPVVESRKVFDNHVISFGHMNDEFQLRGQDEPLKLDSRFSAWVVRHEGALKLAGLHLSVDAFENPVNEALMSSLKSYAIGGAIVLLAGGFLLGWLIRGKS